MASAMISKPTRYMPHSSTVLLLGGVILVGLGLYFMFLRPPLLPEDPRYMGTSLEEIRSGFPGLLLAATCLFCTRGLHGFDRHSDLLSRQDEFSD
jgi:hypothetical protein